jgi:hypothetical protein
MKTKFNPYQRIGRANNFFSRVQLDWGEGDNLSTTILRIMELWIRVLSVYRTTIQGITVVYPSYYPYTGSDGFAVALSGEDRTAAKEEAIVIAEALFEAGVPEVAVLAYDESMAGDAEIVYSVNSAHIGQYTGCWSGVLG